MYYRENHSHGNMLELGNYIHYRSCHCRHAVAPSDLKIIANDLQFELSIFPYDLCYLNYTRRLFVRNFL